MPQPRLRAKRYRGDLTPGERHFLRFGRQIGDVDGSVPFGDRRAGVWTVDLKAAREAWEDHRADILESLPAGFTVWAAVQWDGATGPVSPYADLEVDA